MATVQFCISLIFQGITAANVDEVLSNTTLVRDNSCSFFLALHLAFENFSPVRLFRSRCHKVSAGFSSR